MHYYRVSVMRDDALGWVVLLLLLPPSQAILEDLKAGLGGAKTYLDKLLPMLAEGIKAVQVCVVHQTIVRTNFSDLWLENIPPHVTQRQEFGK